MSFSASIAAETVGLVLLDISSSLKDYNVPNKRVSKKSIL